MPSELPRHLVSWAATSFPAHSWREAQVRHGAFHDVVVAAQDAVLRVATGRGHRQRADREVSILRELASAPVHLGVEVPRLLAEPVSDAHRTGYLVSKVPGSDPSPADWSALRASYAALLDALCAAPADVDLPPARAWCGGPGFPSVVRQRLGPALGRHLAPAIAVVDALVSLRERRRRVLVHGDFGPHNVLWCGADAVSLVDLDHACVDDPAIDVAPLIGVYGAERVSEITSEEVIHRGMMHRATLSLQVAAAADLAGRNALRDHALATFVSRCGSGTLHDPDGLAP